MQRLGLPMLPPTDVALWLRMERCNRFLALCRAERASQGDNLFSDATVLPQHISPLLSVAGRAFEQSIEDAARASHDVVLDCRIEDAPEGDRPDRRDETRLVKMIHALRPGTTAVCFQTRLEIQNLWGWRVLGDIDLIRMERSHDGSLACLIVDSKASGNSKTEHFVQLAFYRAMLLKTLESRSIVSASVEIGVIYRGAGSVPANSRQRTEAKRLFGLETAYLDIATQPEVFEKIARDLVASPDSPVRATLRQTPEEAAFSFNIACVGCRYTAWCCKHADEHLDLSLIPYLSAREKKALLKAGVTNITTLAELKQPAQDSINTVAIDRKRLVTTSKYEETVQQLTSSPAGPTLDTLILRAKAFVRRDFNLRRTDDAKRVQIKFPTGNKPGVES